MQNIRWIQRSYISILGTRSNNLKRLLKDNYQIVMQTFFRKK